MGDESLAAGVIQDDVEEELHGGRPCIYFDNHLTGHLFQACFVASGKGFRRELRGLFCAPRTRYIWSFSIPFRRTPPAGVASCCEAKIMARVAGSALGAIAFHRVETVLLLLAGISLI